MKIELLKGDITKLSIDAIVNAANSSLLGGGGVDGAIHRAGGREILDECKKIRDIQGGCKVGESVITSAGLLPCKNVIHTVGPVWKGGINNEPDKLRNCYFNSLKLAEKSNLKEIAFPNISTGVYGYPKDRAALIALETVQTYTSEIIEKVIFICFDEENYTIYSQLLNEN